jgi:hypothetical protein
MRLKTCKRTATGSGLRRMTLLAAAQGLKAEAYMKGQWFRPTKKEAEAELEQLLAPGVEIAF